MKKTLFAAVFLLMPGVAFAAYNDVTLTTDTIFTVGGVTINVSGSSASLETATVNSAGTLSIAMQSGSSLEITAPDRNMLSVDTPTGIPVTMVCNSSTSKVTLSSNVGVTVTITPSSDLCGASTTSTSSGGGNGPVASGGSGGGSVVASTAVLPTTTTAEVSTTAVVTTSSPALSQTQISAILSLLSSFGADQKVIDDVQSALSGATVAVNMSSITKTLKRPMRDAQVTALQKMLNNDPDTLVASTGPGSIGNETNLYGIATEAAVKKFQAKYGIVSSGTAATTGYGVVGPKTIVKLNALYVK